MQNSSVVPKIKQRLRPQMPTVRLLHGVIFHDMDGVIQKVVIAVGLNEKREKIGVVLPVERDWQPNGVKPTVVFLNKPEEPSPAQKEPSFEVIAGMIAKEHAGVGTTLLWSWKPRKPRDPFSASRSYRFRARNFASFAR